ncbi:TPA: hypothetical protein EYP84_00950 [Candidatus Bipolaricaulota bacterium]|nr:hypothetical protein [Candidatus Bipolaricaulota bacterium]HIP99455.1 hypothetical protein [Candidatus Bipolaricaulota bacterium]
MPYDWFAAERLALEQHRLLQAAAERRRRLGAQLQEARVRRELERTLSRAMKALPREELQALVGRTLRATG